jgi:ankyrin repeat protein
MHLRVLCVVYLFALLCAASALPTHPISIPTVRLRRSHSDVADSDAAHQQLLYDDSPHNSVATTEANTVTVLSDTLKRTSASCVRCHPNDPQKCVSEAMLLPSCAQCLNDHYVAYGESSENGAVMELDTAVCVPCQNPWLAVLLNLALIVLGWLAAASKSAKHWMMLLRVLMNFYQGMSLLSMIRIQWPANVLYWSNVLFSWASIDGGTSQLDCFAGHIDQTDRMLWFLAYICIVITSALFVRIGLRYDRREAPQSEINASSDHLHFSPLNQALHRLVTLVLLHAFPTFFKYLWSFVSCENGFGSGYMLDGPFTSCRLFSASLAVTVLFTIVVTVPVFAVSVLPRFTYQFLRLGKPMPYYLRYLCECYKFEAASFDLWTMLRTIFLTMLLGVIHNPSMQAFAGICVTALYMIVVLQLKPFRPYRVTVPLFGGKEIDSSNHTELVGAILQLLAFVVAFLAAGATSTSGFNGGFANAREGLILTLHVAFIAWTLTVWLSPLTAVLYVTRKQKPFMQLLRHKLSHSSSSIDTIVGEGDFRTDDRALCDVLGHTALVAISEHDFAQSRRQNAVTFQRYTAAHRYMSELYEIQSDLSLELQARLHAIGGSCEVDADRSDLHVIRDALQLHIASQAVVLLEAQLFKAPHVPLVVRDDDGDDTSIYGQVGFHQSSRLLEVFEQIYRSALHRGHVVFSPTQECLRKQIRALASAVPCITLPPKRFDHDRYLGPWQMLTIQLTHIAQCMQQELKHQHSLQSSGAEVMSMTQVMTIHDRALTPAVRNAVIKLNKFTQISDDVKIDTLRDSVVLVESCELPSGLAECNLTVLRSWKSDQSVLGRRLALKNMRLKDTVDSVLHIAVQLPASEEQIIGLIEYLIESGAELSAQNAHSQTPVMCALALGRLHIVHHLLSTRNRQLFHAVDSAGANLLHHALGYGNQLMVADIVRCAPNHVFQQQLEFTGSTPLEMAILLDVEAQQSDSMPLTRAVIDHMRYATDFDAPNRRGQTAFYVAVALNQRHIAESIRSACLKLDRTHDVALHSAVCSGDNDFVGIDALRMGIALGQIATTCRLLQWGFYDSWSVHEKASAALYAIQCGFVNSIRAVHAHWPELFSSVDYATVPVTQVTSVVLLDTSKQDTHISLFDVSLCCGAPNIQVVLELFRAHYVHARDIAERVHKLIAQPLIAGRTSTILAMYKVWRDIFAQPSIVTTAPTIYSFGDIELAKVIVAADTKQFSSPSSKAADALLSHIVVVGATDMLQMLHDDTDVLGLCSTRSLASNLWEALLSGHHGLLKPLAELLASRDVAVRDLVRFLTWAEPLECHGLQILPQREACTMTLTHAAILTGNVESMQQLDAVQATDYSLPTSSGYTCLALACLIPQDDMFEYVMKRLSNGHRSLHSRSGLTNDVVSFGVLSDIYSHHRNRCKRTVLSVEQHVRMCTAIVRKDVDTIATLIRCYQAEERLRAVYVADLKKHDNHNTTFVCQDVFVAAASLQEFIHAHWHANALPACSDTAERVVQRLADIKVASFAHANAQALHAIDALESPFSLSLRMGHAGIATQLVQFELSLVKANKRSDVFQRAYHAFCAFSTLPIIAYPVFAASAFALADSKKKNYQEHAAYVQCYRFAVSMCKRVEPLVEYELWPHVQSVGLQQSASTTVYSSPTGELLHFNALQWATVFAVTQFIQPLTPSAVHVLRQPCGRILQGCGRDLLGHAAVLMYHSYPGLVHFLRKSAGGRKLRHEKFFWGCLSTPNADGNTPMLVALNQRCSAAVDILSRAGISLNARNSKLKQSAVDLAIKSLAIDQLTILAKGKEISDEQYRKLCQHGIAQHNMDAVQFTLSHQPRLLTEVDKNGTQLLHRAVQTNDLQVAQLALQCGAPVCSPTSDGMYPIVLACLQCNEDMVTLLQQHGSNLSLSATKTSTLFKKLKKEMNRAARVPDEKSRIAVMKQFKTILDHEAALIIHDSKTRQKLLQSAALQKPYAPPLMVAAILGKLTSKDQFDDGYKAAIAAADTPSRKGVLNHLSEHWSSREATVSLQLFSVRKVIQRIKKAVENKSTDTVSASMPCVHPRKVAAKMRALSQEMQAIVQERTHKRHAIAARKREQAERRRKAELAWNTKVQQDHEARRAKLKKLKKSRNQLEQQKAKRAGAHEKAKLRKNELSEKATVKSKQLASLKQSLELKATAKTQVHHRIDQARAQKERSHAKLEQARTSLSNTQEQKQSKQEQLARKVAKVSQVLTSKAVKEQVRKKRRAAARRRMAIEKQKKRKQDREAEAVRQRADQAAKQQWQRRKRAALQQIRHEQKEFKNFIRIASRVYRQTGRESRTNMKYPDVDVTEFASRVYPQSLAWNYKDQRFWDPYNTLF